MFEKLISLVWKEVRSTLPQKWFKGTLNRSRKMKEKPELDPENTSYWLSPHFCKAIILKSFLRKVRKQVTFQQSRLCPSSMGPFGFPHPWHTFCPPLTGMKHNKILPTHLHRGRNDQWRTNAPRLPTKAHPEEGRTNGGTEDTSQSEAEGTWRDVHTLKSLQIIIMHVVAHPSWV